jgi:hypothetical protein
MLHIRSIPLKKIFSPFFFNLDVAPFVHSLEQVVNNEAAHIAPVVK